jgi:hypothetical protein
VEPSGKMRSNRALVGEAQLVQGDVAQNVVLIRSARDARCTGIVLGRDIVVTAAHCTSDAAELRIYRSTDRRRELQADRCRREHDSRRPIPCR